MKKNLQLAAMLVAFGMFTLGAAICPAQIAGGYNDAATNDKDVAMVANFAVAEQNKKQKNAAYKLVSIEKAEKQVVAGLNYRMCLTVKTGDANQQATAVVYQNLQNKYSLSEWTEGNCAGDETTQNPADESVTYKGQLDVGKTGSTILYVGEETGDYAAFCFTNDSEVGRKILAACKTGEQCEFTGKVDFESACKVKNLEANLSASGKITTIDSVKAVNLKKTTTKAQIKTVAAIAPDMLVKNLYAADTANASPFSQTKNRASVDKFFTKDFADMIWKDATTANGEVGAIDGDPLYNAQDMKITAFIIGKPEYDTGSGSGMATVLVSFKNFGKADTVKYLFDKDDAGNWKITDIVFKNGDMLKGILFDSQR